MIFIDFLSDNKEVLIALTIITSVTFLTSIIVIPLLIINISPDYFLFKRHSMYEYKHPFTRVLVLIIKNVLGYILFLLGIIMLFIPGQGLLSMALGLLFMNFPGKKKVEKKLFSNIKIKKIINVIRRKFGRKEISF